MKLPNVDAAEVTREKITGYLLNAKHPDAMSKARFFGALGFEIDRWQALADALRRVPAENEVKHRVQSQYGQKYVVDGLVAGPTGRVATIRTVWIIDQEQTVPRLVTA